MNVNLKSFISIFLGVAMGFSAVSCSDVKFSNAPSADCAAGDACIVTKGGETITKILNVPFPNTKVDILFVVDNSRTMIEEQGKMVSRLQGFLDRIGNLDYRIAIATTDNNSAQRTDLYNPQDYRNGQLVPFLSANNGKGSFNYATDVNGQKIYFIQKDTPQVTTLFQNTIYRPESAWCAQTGNQAACPAVISGDERGIYTAVKNIKANSHGFIRSEAQLHVVIISDEDERSNGGGFPGMPIEVGNDRPDDILNVLKGLNKRTKVHSIVDLPGVGSTFESCVASQINDTSRQEYKGCNYIKASSVSGGITASKDAADYSGILSAIGNDIDNTAIDRITFNCKPSKLVITNDGSKPFPSSIQNGLTVVNLNTDYYTFSPALPAGTSIKYTWTCPR